MDHVRVPPDAEIEIDAEPPFRLSYLVNTFRRHFAPIIVATLVVAMTYAIVAIALYLAAPTQRVTALPFRLDFQGATLGQYPNGTRFRPSEIVSVPNLLYAYRANDMGRFASFDTFSHSVFVLESNPEYDRVSADYQARLADQRLTAVDRDRVQREFETRLQTIPRNGFALNFVRTAGNDRIPETVVRKALSDILTAWANRAVNEHHVLDYRLSVLTPQILDETPLEQNDYVMAVQMLRSRLNRVLDNITDVQKAPSAELIRSKQNLSLEEIRIRLEDLKRFRLEPLAALIRTSGLTPHPAATLHFLESQLAYDQGVLRGTQLRIDHIRQAFTLYTGDERSFSDTAAGDLASGRTAPKAGDDAQRAQPSTVVPQLSEGFLDRLVTLTNHAGDATYRQAMVDELRTAAAALIPAQQAVDYDQEILNEFKSGSASAAGTVTPAVAVSQMDIIRNEARSLISQIDEIYGALTRDLNPSAQLYTLTSPPVTRIERSASLARLMMWGVMLIVITFALATAIAFLRERLRTEAAEDRRLVTEEPAAAH